jgi:hypothetical protein
MSATHFLVSIMVLAMTALILTLVPVHLDLAEQTVESISMNAPQILAEIAELVLMELTATLAHVIMVLTEQTAIQV